MPRSRSWLLGALGLGLGASVVRSLTRRLDLRDRVVLVTGGSRGLGLQLARELGDRGARVAICGRDPQTLTLACEDLRGRGVTVEAFPIDLTELDEIPGLVRQVRLQMGRIDVLVNNAGTIEVGPREALTWEDHQRAMNLHCWAPLRLVEECLPDLRAARGTVVNITSIGGRIAVPHLLAYSASKHAELGLSHGLRVELARCGVKVLTVIPGLMNTGGPEHATFKGHHRDEFAWFYLLDTAPGLAVSAERAARRIVRALVRRRSELVIGPYTRLALGVEALAPGATYAVASAIDRWLLPDPSRDARPHRGRDSASREVRRRAPARAHRAAEQLNQESS